MWVAVLILGVLGLGVVAGSLINPAVGLAFVILIALTAPAVFLGSEQMRRQRRLLQMRRFRRNARSGGPPLTEQDKHTTV